MEWCCGKSSSPFSSLSLSFFFLDSFRVVCLMQTAHHLAREHTNRLVNNSSAHEPIKSTYQFLHFLRHPFSAGPHTPFDARRRLLKMKNIRAGGRLNVCPSYFTFILHNSQIKMFGKNEKQKKNHGLFDSMWLKIWLDEAFEI